MTFRPLLIAPSVLVMIACGGSTPPPTPPAAATASADPASSSAPASSGSAASAGGTAPIASDDPGAVEDDSTESSAPIAMAALVTKGTPKSAFPESQNPAITNVGKTPRSPEKQPTIFRPSSTNAERRRASWSTRSRSKGKLHSKADKRDTYILKLMGGYCYRYFAVGDGSIKDLDILVEKPDGALIAADKTDEPFAIIDSGNTWCMDTDAEYHFAIEVDGVGKGTYMFGVWVKPKGK